MKYEALIFDMDGLMIDTERLYFEVERQIAKELGKEVKDSTLQKMMGKKPIESIQIFISDLDLDIDPYKLLNYRDELMLKKFEYDLEPMKGLIEILYCFKDRLQLAIGTGAHRKFVNIMLDKFNLHNVFSCIVSNEDIILGKPNPEIYLKCAKSLNLEPYKCIVLEDSYNGALAGKNANCYTIAIPSEYTKSQDFSFVNYIAKDLIDAKAHILSIL